MSEEQQSQSGNYSVDFWDVSIAPNVEALPPALYQGPEVPANPFVKAGKLFMIVGHGVIDPKWYDTSSGDPALWCQELYQLMGVTCIVMSEHLYETLSPYWQGEKVTLITEELALNGRQFFGDYRAAAKIWIPNTAATINPDAPNYIKREVALTDDVISQVCEFMFIYAREIVQDEFERRFLRMRPGGTVEAVSWETQKHEAREWLDNLGQNGSRTPFLDYLAQEHGKDKTELANRILEKAEAYQDALSDLLVQEQTVIKDFKNCTNVWDMNIKYEQYFGLPIPINQAKAMGLTEGPDSNIRKTEVPHGFQF
jgi:hypothetical protein